MILPDPGHGTGFSLPCAHESWEDSCTFTWSIQGSAEQPSPQLPWVLALSALLSLPSRLNSTPQPTTPHLVNRILFFTALVSALPAGLSPPRPEHHQPRAPKARPRPRPPALGRYLDLAVEETRALHDLLRGHLQHLLADAVLRGHNGSFTLGPTPPASPRLPPPHPRARSPQSLPPNGMGRRTE